LFLFRRGAQKVFVGAYQLTSLLVLDVLLLPFLPRQSLCCRFSNASSTSREFGYATADTSDAVCDLSEYMLPACGDNDYLS
jgi:hypothetical protein